MGVNYVCGLKVNGVVVCWGSDVMVQVLGVCLEEFFLCKFVSLLGLYLDMVVG